MTGPAQPRVEAQEGWREEGGRMHRPRGRAPLLGRGSRDLPLRQRGCLAETGRGHSDRESSRCLHRDKSNSTHTHSWDRDRLQLAALANAHHQNKKNSIHTHTCRV